MQLVFADFLSVLQLDLLPNLYLYNQGLLNQDGVLAFFLTDIVYLKEFF